MNKAKKILCMIIVTNNDSTKFMEPRKKTFNFPAPLITAKFSAVLRYGFLSIAFMRGNQFNALFAQFGVQWIRVISFIADQSLRQLLGKNFGESLSDKADFMRRSRVRVDGERKTSAVCHCHDLRTFTPLGLSDLSAPFFAATKVPSIKHSLKSNSPRVRKSSAKASRTLFKVPSLTHIWKRRWQVWYGGNLPGKSCHRAPVRNIQRIPSNTSRFSRHGLPRPSSRRLGSAMSGSRIAHCSSVNCSLFAML